jgi:hypothetical protein
MPKHELSTAERQKGAEKAAEAKREKREESRRLAAERLSGLVSRAIDELEELIANEDPRVRLRAAQQILDRALGKAGPPVDVATVQHDVVLQTAREELARKLAAIAERRGGDRGAIQHKRGVKIVDVAKVAIECGMITDNLDEATVVRLLSDLLDRRLIELPVSDETRRSVLNGLYETGVIRPSPAAVNEHG